VTDTACELLAVRTLADEGLTSGEIAKILKYNEYRVAKLLGNTVSTEACRRMVEACRATDLEIKRSFTSGYEPLERLICTI
jgi:DNA polymerase III delta subunit